MFKLRPIEDRDLQAVTLIRNSANSEPSSVDDVREWHANDAKTNNVYHYFVAESGEGAILGTGVVCQNDWMPKGRWYCKVIVHPDHKGKGVGQALWEECERVAREGGAEVIESFMKGDDDSSFAWAGRRGFQNDRLRTESILSLKDWDGSRFAGQVERVEATGIKFVTHSPSLPETDEFLNALYDLHAATFVDVPIFIPPFPSFETWVKEFRGEAKSKAPIFSVFAYDGDKIVGESTISLPRCEGAGAWTNYTAVRRDYRGRGLALALKLFTIEAAVKHSVPHMRTNNDPDNPAMLAVNAKLGYVMVSGPRRVIKNLKAE